MEKYKVNVQKIGTTKHKKTVRKCTSKKVVKRKITNKRPKQAPLHRVMQVPANSTIIIEF